MAPGTIESDYLNPDMVGMFGDTGNRVVVTPGNFDLLVLNKIASLLQDNHIGDIDTTIPQNVVNWRMLLDLYPGEFRAGLSQIRLMKPDRSSEIVAYISLDPLDETKMVLNYDADTIPGNTIIGSRGTIDAIVDPTTFNPTTQTLTAGIRYLILENINVNPAFGTGGYDGPDAWKNTDHTDFQAHANDIIEWSGTAWSIIFNSSATTTVTYITNAYTGIQYKWNENTWSKSFEGVYDKGLWRLIL